MRYMIRFSHRIAGPAYRLERVIREVADGTCNEGYLTMRKKDYLRHVAESVNYLIDKMDDKGHEVRELRDQARELAKALQEDPKSSKEVKELARNMVENWKHCAGRDVGQREWNRHGKTRGNTGNSRNWEL